MMNLGQSLFKRLEQAGVDCTFGVPGDFALPLYAAQQTCGLKTIVCTHEPNAAFAADAYARLKGIGVVVATYGVGALNMVNAIAMAYAEHSPVLLVSGAPDLVTREPGYLPHHLVKHYDTQLNIFREVTIAARVIDNPQTAVSGIEWMIQTIQQHKRPGYLEIPRDICDLAVPEKGTAIDESFPEYLLNQDALQEAVAEILSLLDRSSSAVFYAGVGVRRSNLAPQLIQLSERWNIPVISSVLGKASFPELHPNYRGVFMGDMGNKQAREIINNADCVISIGVIHSDVNTGFMTGEISNRRHIAIHQYMTQVHHHRYDQLPIEAVINALVESPAKMRKSIIKKTESTVNSMVGRRSDSLTVKDVIASLQSLDLTRFSVIADIGEAWFVGLELDTNVFVAPGYYASMGFSVPAGLGAAMARKDLRPLIIVGDGAFQMTGSEIATLKQQRIPAIVIVLNNHGYNMLRALDGKRDYFDLPRWDYSGLAVALQCSGEKVSNVLEFENALQRAMQSLEVYLIDVVLEQMDHAPIMENIQNFFSAKKHK